MARSAQRQDERRSIKERFNDFVNMIVENVKNGRTSSLRLDADTLREFEILGERSREQSNFEQSIPSRMASMTRKDITSDAMEATLDLAQVLERSGRVDEWVGEGRRSRRG
jgi:hypothetical protein